MEELIANITIEEIKNIELVDDSVPKKQKSKLINTSPSNTFYKLNVYSANGELKPNFRGETYTDMSKRYGDIMRAVSPTKWVRFDEIAENVARLEKKMRYSSNRTINEIQSALTDLIESGIIIIRE